MFEHLQHTKLYGKHITSVHYVTKRGVSIQRTHDMMRSRMCPTRMKNRGKNLLVNFTRKDK